MDIKDSASNVQISGLYHSDPFWLNDPKILYQNGNYYRFFPSANMTRIEKMNALTRFFVYFLLMLLIFGFNDGLIYIPIIAIILIIMLYYTQKNDAEDSVKELFCQKDVCVNPDICIKPTLNNPFMNVLVSDLMDNPTRPKACNILDHNIRLSAEKFFHQNLLRDVDDLYNRGHSQRQFYTTASTTIPNDQGKFAKWLYNMPETCKVDQTNCLKYEDVRYIRFNPNIDYMDRIKDEI